MVERYDIGVVDCYGGDAWIDYDERKDGEWVKYDDYSHLVDTLTFILTCDQDQLMSEGMDRVRAVLKLAEGK